MKAIAVIDLKAFYASVECIERKLDPFTTPLVVCDTSRGMGTIVLSVSSYLKKLGIPSRCRRRDIPHMSNLIFARPQMALYVSKSAQIMNIILDFVSEEDLHIYSIDECFVNLGPYLALYNKTPEEIISDILKKIKDETGLTATAGISYNPFLAKVCNDIDGKHNAPTYISTWSEKDIKDKLWKITPLSDLWGISTGYETRLNALGINTVGELANTDIAILRENFGIMGDQLHDLANGIDDSDIRVKYVSKTTSFSTGQALFRDFTYKEVRTLFREMTDNLCQRLHENNVETSVVSLAVMYSAKCKVSAGFSHQAKLVQPSDNNQDIYEVVLQMYDKYVQDYPIRRLYLAFGDLRKRNVTQLSLFDDYIEKDEERSANIAIEQVKSKYGRDKIYRATALLDESTYIERTHQIGGHHK